MPYKDKAKRKANAARPENRAKAVARTRAWNKKNPDAHRSWAAGSPRRKAYSKKYRQDNQAHYTALHASWVKENKERADMISLKSQLKKFNLTLEAYDAMVVAQNGVCSVCHRPETVVDKKGKTRRLCIDHDHMTRKVRGLLCSACNLVLGHAQDSIETLLSAVAYLKRHGSGGGDA